MTGAEFIWITSTLISALNSFMGRQGDLKIQAYQTELKNLRKNVDAKNLVSQDKLSKLQNALSVLQNMRVQLDPRVISHIDNAMQKVNTEINNANAEILKNESEYNQKAADAPTSPIAANSQSWNNVLMKPIGANFKNFDQGAGLLG